jgi:hypothetical protein
VRGVGSASLATFVATVSHAAVTGHSPGFVSVVLAWGIAAPICVALTGRNHSWWRLSAAVLTSQVLFHSLLAADLGGGATAVAAGSAGHHADVAALLAPASGVVTTAHEPNSPWMWAAHAVAALVTILALGFGERAVAALAALAAHAFVALAPVRAPGAAPVLLLPAHAPRVVLRLAVLSVMRRRGPPAVA